MTTENNDCFSAGSVPPSAAEYSVEYTHGHKSLKHGDVVVMTESPGFQNLLLRESDRTLHSLTGEHEQYVHLKLIAPPPRAKTQREEDEEALQTWLIGKLFDRQPTSMIWHAALAHRDAQNRADLPALTQIPVPCGPHMNAVARLRKRAGMDA